MVKGRRKVRAKGLLAADADPTGKEYQQGHDLDRHFALDYPSFSGTAASRSLVPSRTQLLTILLVAFPLRCKNRLSILGIMTVLVGNHLCCVGTIPGSVPGPVFSKVDLPSDLLSRIHLVAVFGNIRRYALAVLFQPARTANVPQVVLFRFLTTYVADVPPWRFLGTNCTRGAGALIAALRTDTFFAAISRLLNVALETGYIVDRHGLFPSKPTGSVILLFVAWLAYPPKGGVVSRSFFAADPADDGGVGGAGARLDACRFCLASVLFPMVRKVTSGANVPCFLAVPRFQSVTPLPRVLLSSTNTTLLASALLSTPNLALPCDMQQNPPVMLARPVPRDLAHPMLACDAALSPASPDVVRSRL